MNKKFKRAEIHKFKVGDKNLVLDVQRSSIFEPDELTSDILDICDGLGTDEIVALLKNKYPPDSITEAIEELQEIGIVSEDELNFPSYPCPQKPEVISLDLCFTSEHQSISRDNQINKDSYSRGGNRGKVLHNAVNFLIKESGQQRKCSITFSSNNELPLDFDFIRDMIEYGKEEGRRQNKKINWVLIANTGSFNAKIVKYLKRNKVNVRLNINHSEEIFCRGESLWGSKGSPDMKSREIKKLLNRLQVTVEAKLKAKALPFVNNVSHLFDLGFGLVSIDPSFWPGKGRDVSNKDNLELIKKENEKIAQLVCEEVKRGRLLGLSNFIALMRRIQTHRPKFYGCGAGRYHLAVSSNGDLYPCSRFLGMENFRVGNLCTGIDKNAQKPFIDNYVDAREDCSNCWARYFCGGGCIYESMVKEGGISKPFEPSCELFKHNLKLSLVTFLEMTEDQKLLLKLFGHNIQAHMPHLNNDFGFLNVKDKINCVKPVGDSMLPLIKDGDKVFIKRSQPTEMKVGDVIAFETPQSITIHRIIGKKIRNSLPLLIEKGDNNLHSSPVIEGDIIGKVFAIERSGRIIRLDTKLWRFIDYMIAVLSRFFANFLQRTYRGGRRKRNLSRINLKILHGLILFLPKFWIRALFHFQSLGKESWLKGRYKFKAS